MKKLAVFLSIALFTSCSSNVSSNHSDEPNQHAVHSDSSDSSAIAKTVDFEMSTYDNPKFQEHIKRQVEAFKAAEEKQFFDQIQKQAIRSLSPAMQAYFQESSNYILLQYTQGNIFQDAVDDYSFIVYDKKNTRIAILVYQTQTSKMSELYRDFKVSNSLLKADCNFGSFGTLDFQLGEDILEQLDYILPHPENYLENKSLKIVDLKKDPDMILTSGCFGQHTDKTNLKHSLCISTSSVYNNWNALRYQKDTHSFDIYYAQAFAD